MAHGKSLTFLVSLKQEWQQQSQEWQQQSKGVAVTSHTGVAATVKGVAATVKRSGSNRCSKESTTV